MHGVGPGDSGFIPLTEHTSDTLKKRRKNAPTDGVDHAGGRISIHHCVVFPAGVEDEDEDEDYHTGLKVRGCPRMGIQDHNNFWVNPPDRSIPTGTGKKGRAWLYAVGDMDRDQVGINEVNSTFASGDPSGSIGPGFSATNSEEAAKLKEQLQQLQEEIKETKPKAAALEEAVGMMQRLQQLAGANPESNESPEGK